MLRTKLNKIIQAYRQKSRNRLALMCLVELGFPLCDIRPSLLRLNRIKVPSLAKHDSTLNASTLYNTLKGLRRHTESKQACASALGVDVVELFPKSTDAQGN